MVPYNLGNSDVYCPDQKHDKSYHEEMLQEFSHERHLHHMPSLSTTCTTDSIHESMTSAERGEPSFDMPAESQGFDWPIQSTTSFPWPPNRISFISLLIKTISPRHR